MSQPLQPRVSVVIPTYNSTAFIRRTLDSVLSQTFTGMEVLVVDDGSTDGTRELVGTIGPPVTLAAGKGREGASVARNRGVALARGEYVAFLDHDDLWNRDKIERQVEGLDADPAAGLSFTQARMTRDGRVLEIAPMLDDPAAFLREAYENLAHWNYIPMSSVMVRRSSLPVVAGDEGSGPFDPDLRLAEDWELWLRIASRHKIVFIPEPLTSHVIMPGSATERMADLRLEDIGVFREQLRLNPWLASGDPERCRSTLYRLHEEAGYWLLREGRRPEARRVLRSAWRLRPGSIRPLGYIVASFLGAAGVAAHREAR